MSYNEESLKKDPSDVIKNVEVKGNKVYYERRGTRRDVGKDYLKLLQKKSNGITPTGQRLLQEAMQCFEYSVLGSQSRTHWQIVGEGANSLQTQRVFEDIVKDVIKENNLSDLIKSTRLAIRATKVRLDYCLSPGLELLPSNYLYIKDSPGYNNFLIVSSVKQKFGVNNNVNKEIVGLKPSKDSGVVNVKTSNTRNVKTPSKSKTTEPLASAGEIGLISLGIALIARVVWVALI